MIAKSKTGWLLLIIFLIGGGCFWASSLIGGGCFWTSSHPSFTIRTTHFVSERIPLTYDKYGFLPLVAMRLGNQKVMLALDTGMDTGVIYINSSVLKRLAVHYLKSYRNTCDVQGKVFRGRNFIVPSASIGNIKLANLFGSEESRDFDSIDGLIGNGFLKQFLVLLDYPAGEMILYPKTAYPAELDLTKWTKIPFTRNNIGIIVAGRFGATGRKLKICLDTGVTVNHQGTTMGFIRSAYAPKADLAGKVLIRQFGKDKHPYIRTGHFYLEGLDLGTTQFVVWDFKQPPVDGFLGHNLFVNYRVLIDFDHQVLFVLKK